MQAVGNHGVGRSYGVVNCVGNRSDNWSDNRSSMVDSVRDSVVQGSHSMGSMVDWGHYGSCVVNSMGDSMGNSMGDSMGDSMSSMVGHGVDGVMGMRDGGRDGMVRDGVDSVVRHWVGGVDWVTLGDRLGQEGVEEGVSVESVERGSLSTVDLNSWLC